MDLKSYTLEQLFQSAIKSEQESTKLYSGLSERVKNYFLREKLRFLAREEEKHEKILIHEFRKNLPDTDLVIPDTTPVPLPEVKVTDENVPLSQIIEGAMTAELAAQDFYLSMKEFFEEGDSILRTLDYFSAMEKAHYDLLLLERENLVQFEEYDIYWDMMNIGP